MVEGKFGKTAKSLKTLWSRLQIWWIDMTNHSVEIDVLICCSLPKPLPKATFWVTPSRSTVCWEKVDVILYSSLTTIIWSNSNYSLPTILDKIFGSKYRNPVKSDRTTKLWYPLYYIFLLLLPKFNFWEGDWALGSVSTQI